VGIGNELDEEEAVITTRAKTTSRMRFVAMIAVLALVAAACSSADDDPTTGGGVDTTVAGAEPADTTAPAPAEETATDVTLTFQNWYYGGTMGEVYDEYIASFVEANDSVVGVDVETQPFPRYHDVLNVKLAANQPPSVSWVSASVGPQYVGSGRLVNLLPYIEQMEGYNLDDYPAEALAPWMNGDELVAIPFTNTSNVVFYNTDIFEAAGIPTPIELQEQGNWTWESLKDTSNQLVQAGAADYGFYFNNGIYTPGWRNLIEVYAPYGARPWSDDGKQCLFDSAETIEATQFVWDMVFVDGSHPGPSVAADFAAGNIGMTLGRQGIVSRLAEVPFGWEVTVAPDGPKGYWPSLAQNGLVAWADSENPGLAAQFVLHTTTPENAAKFTVNNPSPRTSLQNIETLSEFPSAFSVEQLERAVIPSLKAENFELEYYHPFYAALDREATVVFDGQVWVEGANIPEAMATLCGNIEPLMTR